jgi:hypothetical protein
VRRGGWWRAVSVYAEVFEFEGPNGRRVCDDMIELNDEERRALDELARHPEGCAEALLLSDGCTIRQLSGLVIDGYAGLQRKRVQAGGREKTVLWMHITEAGRSAIAGSLR